MHRRFSPLGDSRAHFWLTLGMARTLGVTLTDALDSGQITRADYAETVTRCRGCDAALDCAVWMGQQTCSAESAPSYCANGPSLVALRKVAGAAAVAHD